MAFPVLTADAAFGSNPGAASFAWTRIHRDGDLQVVRELTWKRGRLNELNRVETATGALVLKDKASDFDPDNPSGRYSANVRPYVPVRAQATIAGVTYDLFQQFVERWPRTKRVRNVYTERSIQTVDGFEWLARAGLAGASYSSELTSVRAANVLDTAGWSSALRSIGTGQDTIVAASFAADDDTRALSHLLDVADSENGLLFIDASGNVKFVGRHALVTSPYTTSQVTFRDADAGGGGFQFVDSTPSYDLDTTFNEWAGTRIGGITQTASDSTSKTRYGKRSQQFASLVLSDSTVLAQMQWKLKQFKDPLNRIESITVMPGNDTAFWQAVLGLEIGERITVKEKPPGYSAVKSSDYTIQSIEVRVPDGPVSQARFTFGLWPSDITTWWVAGITGLAGVDTYPVY